MMKYLLIIVTTLMVCNAQALERPIASLPSAVGLGKAPEKAGASSAAAALAAPASPAAPAIPAAASPVSSASSLALPPQYLIALTAGAPAAPAIPSAAVFAAKMVPVVLQNSNGSHKESSPSWLQDTFQSAKNAIWGSSGRELRELHKHGDLSRLSDKDVKCIKGLQEQPTNLRSDSSKFVERISKIQQILEACRGTVINPDHFQAIITELDPAILSALLLREELVKLMNQQEELCKQKSGLSHDSAGDQKRQ